MSSERNDDLDKFAADVQAKMAVLTPRPGELSLPKPRTPIDSSTPPEVADALTGKRARKPSSLGAAVKGKLAALRSWFTDRDEP